MKKLLFVLITILSTMVFAEVHAQQKVWVIHSSASYVITNGVGVKYEQSVTISFKTGGFIVKSLNNDPIEFFFTKFIREREGCYYGEVITTVGEKYYFWLSFADNELTWSPDPKNRNGIQYIFDTD